MPTKKIAKSTLFKTVLQNWMVIVALIASILLWRWNLIPSLGRTLVMLPMALFLTTLTYLLWRSIFCRTTTDLIGGDPTLREIAWNSLTPAEQMKLFIYERVGVLIVIAIIYAGMTIIYGGPIGAAAAIETKDAVHETQK